MLFNIGIGILSSLLFLTSQWSPSLAHQGHECDCYDWEANVCTDKGTVQLAISSDYKTCQVKRLIERSDFRDDYTHHPGVGYYKFFGKAKTWDEARKICMSEGANLAVPDSMEEHQVLLTMLKGSAPRITGGTRDTHVWLGAHNHFDNKEWTTVHGKRLYASGHINWSKGCEGYAPEPNNYPGTEHCLSIYNKCDFGWNDYTCNTTLGFICEKSESC